MKPVPRRLSLLLAGLTLALLPGETHAALFGLFGKKKAPTTVPPAGQLQAAEVTANSLMTKARADESAGRDGAAMSGYKQIVQKYPFTSMAPAAQFRIAAQLEKERKYKKSFDAYQELLTTYRQSPQFAEALDRQFEIAMLSRRERTGSFLGIKRRMDPAELVEMFSTVIQNAPQGVHAAEAQYEIGLIHEEEEESEQAIAAFRKVAENYPKSTRAQEAMTRVGQVHMSRVQEGSRDASNISEATKAIDEASGLWPAGSVSPDLLNMKNEVDAASADAAYPIGRFYEKKGNHRAAMIYYATILQSPGSTHFEEVRERVNAMSSRDPKLMDSIKGLALNPRDLAVPAAADLKGKAEYFGPPAPVQKVASVIRRPRMRGPGDFIPITPLEEPELPTGTERMKPDDTLLNPSVPLPEATPPIPDPSLPPPTLDPAPTDPPAPPETPAPPATPPPDAPVPNN